MLNNSDNITGKWIKIYILNAPELNSEPTQKMKNEDHVSLTKYSGTIEIKYQFYNNYRNHAHSLTNYYFQYADRHINLKFLRRIRERERAI